MDEYIVRSGDGYVFNSQSLEMISDPQDFVNAALRAQRMTLAKAIEVTRAMTAAGLDVGIVHLRIGHLPMVAI